MFPGPYNGDPRLNSMYQIQMQKALEEGLAQRAAQEKAEAARILAERSVAAQTEYNNSEPLDVTREQLPSNN